MRDLARRVAEAYVAGRKELEFPLLKAEGAGAQAVAARADGKQPAAAFGAKPAAFLLEIGVEELPAGDLDSALEQLRKNVPAWLDELRLEHGPVSVAGTPRRLAVLVEALAAHQPDREDLVKGPPAERAFGPDGVPTPAALGFAKSKGVDPKSLEKRAIDGGNYVVAVVKQTGRPAHAVLSETLPGLVAGIKFDKSMRWNASGVAFSRPIRWLVAELGETVVPFEYAGLRSANLTRGLRPYGSPEIAVPAAGKYFALLKKNGIVFDLDERKAQIEAGVKALAASVGGEALVPPELLAEVANLVEMPTPLLGSFNPEFLSLPGEVLISVMKKHQRYFPIQKQGKLLPNFVIVRNGDDQQLDLVRQGNEHVVGARFADANFFVREDLKHKLEDFRPKLAGLAFQKKLGSMLDKSERIEKLVVGLAAGTNPLRLSQDEADVARRAAHLGKADLMTHMVVEMTSLQGIMGREYALRSGEPQAVAQAIGEQYLPVPRGKPGLAIALADRLDSLTGLFAAGLAPTGAKDPFGLRRAAIGVVQPLIEHDLPFDLREGVRIAAGLQPIPADEKVQAQVLEFLQGRLRVVLLDMGFKYDVADAVLAAQGSDPAAAARAVKELSGWVARKDWTTLLPGYARCVRITRDQKSRFEVRPEAFVEPAEKGLFAALQQAEAARRAPRSVDDFLNAFAPMIPAVNEFFDKVLVMAEDRQVQQNRLGLLQRIAALAEGVADLSKLEGF